MSDFDFGFIDIDAPLPPVQAPPLTVITVGANDAAPLTASYTQAMGIVDSVTHVSPDDEKAQSEVAPLPEPTEHVDLTDDNDDDEQKSSSRRKLKRPAWTIDDANDAVADQSPLPSLTSLSTDTSATRFLDAFTPLKSPLEAPSVASCVTEIDKEFRSLSAQSSLRDQLELYKRRKSSEASARSDLRNTGVKHSAGGMGSNDDFIDLKSFTPAVNKVDRPVAMPSSHHFHPLSPWMSRRYQSPNFSFRLHEELLDFASFVSPTPAEERQRAQLIQRLTSLVQLLYPIATVKAFGSYATKLYLPMSDIDIVIFDTPDVDAKSGHHALKVIADAITSNDMASYIEVIANARIPIIKFTDKVTGIKIDISRDQPSGLESAQWIQSIMTTNPAFRPLTLFLKYFLQCRSLNDTYTGGIGSFMLQLLLVSHLHFHPSQTLDVNLGLLLLSFFDTYAHHYHYGNVGLTVNPPSFYSKHGQDRFNASRPYLLSVQNPLDADHDVGANSYAVLKVRKAFQYAYAQLTRKDVIEGSYRDSILALVVSADDALIVERAKMRNWNRSEKDNGSDVTDSLPLTSRAPAPAPVTPAPRRIIRTAHYNADSQSQSQSQSTNTAETDKSRKRKRDDSAPVSKLRRQPTTEDLTIDSDGIIVIADDEDILSVNQSSSSLSPVPAPLPASSNGVDRHLQEMQSKHRSESTLPIHDDLPELEPVSETEHSAPPIRIDRSRFLEPINSMYPFTANGDTHSQSQSAAAAVADANAAAARAAKKQRKQEKKECREKEEKEKKKEKKKQKRELAALMDAEAEAQRAVQTIASTSPAAALAVSPRLLVNEDGTMLIDLASDDDEGADGDGDEEVQKQVSSSSTKLSKKQKNAQKRQEKLQASLRSIDELFESQEAKRDAKKQRREAKKKKKKQQLSVNGNGNGPATSSAKKKKKKHYAQLQSNGS